MKKIDWQNLDRSIVKVEESPVANWRVYFPKGGNEFISTKELESLRKAFNFRFDMHDPSLQLAYDCKNGIFFPMLSFMVRRAKARAKADAELLAAFDERVTKLKGDIAKCTKDLAELEEMFQAAQVAIKAIKEGENVQENIAIVVAYSKACDFAHCGSNESAIDNKRLEKARLEKMLTDLMERGRAHGKTAA